MLGGAIAGWLKTRLREEAGATYGVQGEVLVNRGGATHLSLSFEVAPVQLAGVYRIVKGHWEGFSNDGFDAGTLSQIRWSLLTTENLAFRTSNESAMRVATAANLDQDLSSLILDGKWLDSVTAESLRRSFATCHKSTLIQLTGNRAAIRLE